MDFYSVFLYGSYLACILLFFLRPARPDRLDRAAKRTEQAAEQTEQADQTDQKICLFGWLVVAGWFGCGSAVLALEPIMLALYDRPYSSLGLSTLRNSIQSICRFDNIDTRS